MADADDQVEDDGAEDEEGKKKGGLKKILMILLPLLLIGGGGGGAYYMGYLDSLLGVEAEAEGEEGEHAEGEDGDHGDDGHGDDGHAAEDDHGDDSHAADDGHGGDDGHGEEGGGSSAFLAIPSMIVNLNTEDGTPRFLRLTVQLELEDPSEYSQVEAVLPRVIDQFQTYLRELRVRDLRGSAGIYRLQMELLWRVNKAVDPVKVKDVLFQEILIQ
ncbi:MAG: flagellar basal body-associated FliL family protein [Alphaproteobacteria bacterium]